MQSRRDFLKQVGLGAAALAMPTELGLAAEPRKRPNFIFIMTDDHAAQAIGCYGSRINKTPNIDRLATQGVRMDSAFCTNAICAPSRAVLLTGKYSHVNGVLDNSAAFDGSQQTFPKLLQKAGYETALFGKWHLKSAPTGFDHHSILPGQGHYYNPDIITMGEKKRRSGYVTDLTTDDCLDWLANREQDRPFCVLLHHKAPHRNWMPGPDHLDLYEGKEIPEPETLFDDYATRSAAAREQEMTIARHFYPAYDLKLTPGSESENAEKREKDDRRMWKNIYGRLDEAQRDEWDVAYDPRNERFREAPPTGDDLIRWNYQRYIKDYLRCIASVDDNVGRVLDALDAAGLSEDTVVVYTSDQGFYLGEHGWYDKRFMYEESLRIPMIVRYPREIQAGGVNEEDLVLNLDFAPTFLDYAGVKAPGDMQGHSLRKVVAGATPEDWRQSIYYHYFEYPGAHAVKRHYGVRTKQYKLIHFYNDIDAWELFDLKADPNELNNLYDDPAHAKVVGTLKKEFARLREEFGDTEESPHMPAAGIERNHKARGCPVRLKNAFAKKYSGGGPNALTDGIVSPEPPGTRPDYSLWQGFEEVDLEAVVDLGDMTSIDRVSVGFLQHVHDWIFPPTSVDFALSEDGRSFSNEVVVKGTAIPNRDKVLRQSFRHAFGKKKVRYVRVRAKNVGRCPADHAGAGGKTWIFADEIVVE